MITITNEDNMQLMARYPDNYFDLAIVDPPYGMLGNTFRVKSPQFTNGFASAALDKSELSEAKISLGERPTQEYFDELFRVSKNQIIFGMQYFVQHLIPHQAVLIWDKKNGTNRFSDFEIAWTSFDTATRIVNRWMQPCGRIHPTQKPVELYRWILTNYAKEGNKILDTHLGSGSIALACHNLKFDLTACELDNDYFDAALKRLKDHQAQLTMF